MPVSLLVPLVLASFALVGGLTWALGWSALAELDADTARRWFERDHPEARVDDVCVATDRRSALLWTVSSEADGAGALVFTVGDRFAVRTLARAHVRAVEGALDIAFGDPATPAVRVPLDGAALAVWDARLVSRA